MPGGVGRESRKAIPISSRRDPSGCPEVHKAAGGAIRLPESPDEPSELPAESVLAACVLGACGRRFGSRLVASQGPLRLAPVDMSGGQACEGSVVKP